MERHDGKREVSFPGKGMQRAEYGVVLQFCRDRVERVFLFFCKPVDEQVKGIRCAPCKDEMVRLLCVEKVGQGIQVARGIMRCSPGR